MKNCRIIGGLAQNRAAREFRSLFQADEGGIANGGNDIVLDIHGKLRALPQQCPTWAKRSNGQAGQHICKTVMTCGFERTVKPMHFCIGFETGSSSWTRTSDHSINSRMLYQLSYRGMSVRPIAEGYTD